MIVQTDHTFQLIDLIKQESMVTELSMQMEHISGG